MNMNKQDFDKWFRRFHFVDCAVRAKDFVYFLGRKEYDVSDDGSHAEESDIDKRIVNILLSEPVGSQYGAATLTGFSTTGIGASLVPTPHAVAVDYSGQVYSRGRGLPGMEISPATDDDKGPTRGGMLKLRTIGGYVYCAGSRRNVCRREGPNHWVPLWGDSLPLPKVKDTPDFNNYGFEDIDGFSTEDIYAVGGRGDVWDFDGRRWKQLGFPSNMWLENVCCGGDGFVYIGAQGGEVFRGRGNKWEHINKGGLLRFEDMVWFQGSVWCTNDYGIWTITNGKLAPAELPAHMPSCAGYASSADGVLLLAGMYGAAMHNGQAWVSLVDMNALYRQFGRK